MPNILMPALSPTMEEGKLAKWLVKEGDTVSPGDVLAEIETDKATMEVESIDSGTVKKLLVAEGTEGVKVNTPIALVLAEGEQVGDEQPAEPATKPEVVAETVPAIVAASAAGAPTFVPAADPDLPANVEYVEMTVREALREAMAEEMRRDPDIFIMGEEVAQYQGAYKVTQGLLDEFGEKRVIDTPITEHGFAGLGVGAAFAGLRPIIEFMTWNFAMQAIDQIINSAAKQLYMSGGQVTAPIVFRGPNGVASRVAAQHSQDYSAWYSHIPGLTVVAPFSAADAKGLLKAAIRSNNPIVFLENEILYGSTGLVPKVDDYVLPIGKARIVREGKDATIVSFSMGMRYALQATEKLVAEGIDVELIDLRTLRPMDSAAVIESVKKTGRLVTVEEGWPQGGIGAELAARVMEGAFDYLDAPVTRVTGKDVPMPYAANLEKLALPNVDEVVAAVKAVTYRN
ncbi:pyruvate dehydrogenase complex E1 component subunit beta [Paradevosia shaoguanensis]|uniref:Pyruvate dehydrogenase E1 component subunit beta n=1 Tax=Paradevosia shaoguanensis TaxID=1335043 RepID=A0AA41QNU3_9HYPH|nr:pyruvate dehydrogenase complex E1 component subunit beta [Paradevosia shaoguanensis]MCF1742438.1 pyruvate dehydrogenase complex E1 component subunit beta [Paradevosia shaoguanensis]MCI0126921.1 pyruvate dehydrogenase complex E1 component subunit beta [Paradevosia shaoguanensis]